jgi:hypothetical protein
MTGFGSGKIFTLGLGTRKINIHDRALKAEQLIKIQDLSTCHTIPCPD